MTLKGIRCKTTKALKGEELPDCFKDATIASAARATYGKTPVKLKEARRLFRKVAKLLAEEGK